MTQQRWSRQTVRRVGTLIVVGCLGLFLGSALAATPRPLVATVERVTDGDSVSAVTDNGTKLRIRLLGIDAPELPHNGQPGQPFAEDARDYLDHLIGGKAVRVEVYGPDQYKRVLGVIWDEGVNVNLLMVAMGYAEVYRGTSCIVYCQELHANEAKARQDRVGMWAQGPKYESPRDFRRRLRLSGN